MPDGGSSMHHPQRRTCRARPQTATTATGPCVARSTSRARAPSSKRLASASKRTSSTASPSMMASFISASGRGGWLSSLQNGGTGQIAAIWPAAGWALAIVRHFGGSVDLQNRHPVERRSLGRQASLAGSRAAG
jgi:hypothetical protein